MCLEASKDETVMVLDVSWQQDQMICNLHNESSLPYFRIDTPISPFVEFLEKYLKARKFEDVVLILEDSECE